MELRKNMSKFRFRHYFIEALLLVCFHFINAWYSKGKHNYTHTSHHLHLTGHSFGNFRLCLESAENKSRRLVGVYSIPSDVISVEGGWDGEEQLSFNTSVGFLGHRRRPTSQLLSNLFVPKKALVFPRSLTKKGNEERRKVCGIWQKVFYTKWSLTDLNWTHIVECVTIFGNLSCDGHIGIQWFGAHVCERGWRCGSTSSVKKSLKGLASGEFYGLEV